MRSKILVLLLLSILGMAIQGCSGGGGDEAKTGVKVLPGDYEHGPGGGAKPATPGAKG